TGGALRNAAQLIRETDVLAMNGDSFCDIDLNALERAHRSAGAAATLAVLWLTDRQRSGALTVDASGRIVGFESRPSTPAAGLINAGVYMLRRDVLNAMPAGRKVSLEDELFPALAERGELFACQVNGRFIDIGTPESYDAAKTFF